MNGRADETLRVSLLGLFSVALFIASLLFRYLPRKLNGWLLGLIDFTFIHNKKDIFINMCVFIILFDVYIKGYVELVKDEGLGVRMDFFYHFPLFLIKLNYGLI